VQFIDEVQSFPIDLQAPINLSGENPDPNPNIIIKEKEALFTDLTDDESWTIIEEVQVEPFLLVNYSPPVSVPKYLTLKKLALKAGIDLKYGSYKGTGTQDDPIEILDD
jgi:hypothetical protein